MLDSLGSTLTRTTIESFFTRFEKSSEGSLTAEEAVICLEDELTKPKSEKRSVDLSNLEYPSSSKAGLESFGAESEQLPYYSLGDNLNGGGLSFTGLAVTGEPKDGVEAKDTLASGRDTLTPDVAARGKDASASSSALSLPRSTPSRHSSLSLSTTSADLTNSTEPATSGVLEKLINIKTCPLCHKKLKKRAEVDMVTHLAVCASQDWSSLSSMTGS